MKLKQISFKFLIFLNSQPQSIKNKGINEYIKFDKSIL